MRLNSRDRLKKKKLGLETLERRQLLTANVLITEFVASNDSTLVDQDGDSSDWLELFNGGNVPVDLGGWHLTDDPSELDKWTIPVTTVGPGEYVVIFASGKDRANSGTELHCNFRLSADGEFLALVQPDGTTISHAYAPFPRQFTDVAYGLPSQTVVSELIGEGSASRVFLPTSTADVSTAAWSVPTFDDSDWMPRSVGLGYSGGSFDNLVHSDGEIRQMQGSSTSAYVRLPFQITDPVSTYDQLELTINYDDGFAAYLNGAKVAARNAPDVLDGTTSATRARDGLVSTVDYAGLAETEGLTLVGDSDGVPSGLRLTGSEPAESGAAWTTQPLAFGPRFSFSAFMQIDITAPGGSSDADGAGGHGMAFVLQSGGQFRLGGNGGALGLDDAGMQFVAVEFDSRSEGSFDRDNSLPSHIGIDSSVQGNVARVAVPRFNGSDDSDPRYAWVDYDGIADRMDVFFSDLRAKPAEPTLSTTLDLQSIFEDSTSLWAGWTAANGDQTWNTHEVQDFRITTSAEYAFEEEIIDFTDFVSALRPGENVLAIHGLNAGVDDDDFLIKPALRATQSHRFDLDSPSYLEAPTPGEPNADATEAPSGEVAFSVTGRMFAEPFDVAITAATSNAEIRYTLDGSIPDEDDELYSGPIRVDTSMRIRARAFEPEKAAGPVSSHGYIALAADLMNFEGGVFESNLPLMVFNSFGGSVDSNATSLVPVSSVFINNDDGRANLLDAPEFAGRAGMRIRGQSSQGWPKKQYALEIWEEGNSDTRPISAARADDRSISIFGLPAESDWVLNGPYADKTQLNNYLTFMWSNAMGQYAPRARLVEVFLKTRPGALSYRDYRGTYVLLEKIKIDPQRVNIAELSPGTTEEPEISGGYIWKYDKNGVGDVNFTTTFQRRSGSSRPWKFVEPQRPPAAQRAWLTDYLTEFENVLYGRNFADPVDGYAKYIDVDSWVDTWLLVEFTKNIDGFRLSTYYYKDLGGKIKQGPAWDYNLSLANANYLEGAYPAGWYHDGLSTGDYPYWGRLFSDPNFEIRVRDRWFELRNSIFSTENLLSDVDAAVSLLTDGNPNLGNLSPGDPSNPISRNFDRWGTLNSYLWPNCFFGTGTCPTSPLPNRGRPDSYDDYIYILKDFIERRAAWIDGRFKLPPEIAPGGGFVGQATEVTITPKSGGTVYFTLDGSDPRDVSGEVSETAIQYESPFNVTENVIVKSRTLRGRTWSGIALQTYFVEIPTVTISELNYHPAPPSALELAAGFTDNEQFEFIELVNYGPEPVSLANSKFVRGVEVTLDDVTVTPGARVVVVRNTDAFRARYGDDPRIVGVYGNPLDAAMDFALKNSGERLTMVGALGEPIVDLSFNDDWYPLTDGEGFSLVRREPVVSVFEIKSQPNMWRPSEFSGGSPGSAERGVVPDPGAVVINEVLRKSSGPQRDAVELFNRTDGSISIGNFLLTVDAGERFHIPAGTQIPPGEFLVLDDRALGADFELLPSDGELTLRGALADGTLTGFQELVEFGASAADRSWGRHETTVGPDFAPLSSVTLGAPNAPPQIGPVVINEIQYHPILGDQEFIELTNISNESVAIADWEMDRAIRYRFPPGAEIAAGGYTVLLKVARTPDAAEQVAAFRKSHSVPDGVEVFVYADTNGSLDNAGEALVLKRPLTSSTLMIEVDRVIYSDEAPWTPRADGLGPSLSRVLSTGYGNDPQNWKSSTIGGTPGAVNTFEDATPPSTPRNLAAAFLPNGAIGLGWSPSSDLDSAVDHYAIYRNGRQVGTSAIPFFRDTIAWMEGQSVSYEVTAWNTDGFASDQSNVVEVSAGSTGFQQGVGRYNGAADAHIGEADADVNHGGERRLLLDGNEAGSTGDAATSLLRWSDISIPQDSMLVGASISLQVVNSGDTYQIKPVLAAWEELEVTWNQATVERPWQLPGARGNDDVRASVGVLEASSRGTVTTHLNADGIDVVREWLDNPAANYGVAIADPGTSTDNVTVVSAQERDSDLRPKLTLFHVPQVESAVGDFNFDGAVNAADIDLLHAALREGIDDSLFDLDGSGLTDQTDVDFLVTNVLGTLRGDADLDRSVGFADFLALTVALASHEDPSWERGDFDGDGRTTFADFLLLAANFKTT